MRIFALLLACSACHVPRPPKSAPLGDIRPERRHGVETNLSVIPAASELPYCCLTSRGSTCRGSVLDTF